MATDTLDSELVTRALAGEHAAFAELVDRYRDAVCAVAYHYLGRFDDVQDAAQEAFVQAYVRLDQLRDAGRFGPWLRSIAANVCMQVLRRGRPTVRLDDVEERAAEADCDPQKAAMGMVVREALNHLSEKTRLTVTLSYIDGYSHSEIAGFLEIPVATVRSRLHHAKIKLREEMITMVTDVLHEGKPEPEFSVQVMQEARKRAHEARAANASGDALKHYDEALDTLEKMRSSTPPREIKRQALAFVEQMAELSAPEKVTALQELKVRKPREVLELLRAEVLWEKGLAAHFPLGAQESAKLLEESLAITDRLGLGRRHGDKLQHIGVTHSNAGQEDVAESYYKKAIDAYRDSGDAAGEANCLVWLGTGGLGAKNLAEGRQYLEQALPLFEKAGTHDWVAVCRALLDMLDEVGEERFATVMGAGGVCECLSSKDGVISHVGQPGWGLGWSSRGPEAALSIGSIFWQISKLKTFLDSSVPVGGSWSGDGFSYSFQPLKVIVTVKSDSESVTVPAGTFERCLVTEQVTMESDLPDEAPEQKRDLNKKILCGTRQAWYAPGVGLVQLHVRTGEGVEALIQLREFSVTQQTSDCLPLAIGNSWVYGWANVPDGYVAKEAYRVAENEGDVWYLEHYHYAFKR